MEGEKLIEEVRKYPALYDQTEARYRNAEYKDSVWKNISDKLKIPGGPEECKKKWTSIRDQFRRTLQKRKTKSGPAKKQKYKFEDFLEFLLPYLAENRSEIETATNAPSLEDSFEFASKIEEQAAELADIVASKLEPASEPEGHDNEVPSAVTSEETSAKRQNFLRQRSIKRKRPNFEQFVDDPSSQLMAYSLAEKEADKYRISNITYLEQHPVDIFLAGLAPILKSLDPILLNQARTAIFTTVQDFELKQILKNENEQQQILPLPLRLDIADHATGSSNSPRSSSPNGSPHMNDVKNY